MDFDTAVSPWIQVKIENRENDRSFFNFNKILKKIKIMEDIYIHTIYNLINGFTKKNSLARLSSSCVGVESIAARLLHPLHVHGAPAVTTVSEAGGWCLLSGGVQKQKPARKFIYRSGARLAV